MNKIECRIKQLIYVRIAFEKHWLLQNLLQLHEILDISHKLGKHVFCYSIFIIKRLMS